jgi:hypothetical protein
VVKPTTAAANRPPAMADGEPDQSDCEIKLPIQRHGAAMRIMAFGCFQV